MGPFRRGRHGRDELRRIGRFGEVHLEGTVIDLGTVIDAKQVTAATRFRATRLVLRSRSLQVERPGEQGLSFTKSLGHEVAKSLGPGRQECASS